MEEFVLEAEARNVDRRPEERRQYIRKVKELATFWPEKIERTLDKVSDAGWEGMSWQEDFTLLHWFAKNTEKSDFKGGAYGLVLLSPLVPADQLDVKDSAGFRAIDYARNKARVDATYKGARDLFDEVRARRTGNSITPQVTPRGQSDATMMHATDRGSPRNLGSLIRRLEMSRPFQRPREINTSLAAEQVPYSAVACDLTHTPTPSERTQSSPKAVATPIHVPSALLQRATPDRRLESKEQLGQSLTPCQSREEILAGRPRAATDGTTPPNGKARLSPQPGEGKMSPWRCEMPVSPVASGRSSAETSPVGSTISPHGKACALDAAPLQAQEARAKSSTRSPRSILPALETSSVVSEQPPMRSVPSDMARAVSDSSCSRKEENFWAQRRGAVLHSRTTGPAAGWQPTNHKRVEYAEESAEDTDTRSGSSDTQGASSCMEGEVGDGVLSGAGTNRRFRTPGFGEEAEEDET